MTEKELELVKYCNRHYAYNYLLGGKDCSNACPYCEQCEEFSKYSNKIPYEYKEMDSEEKEKWEKDVIPSNYDVICPYCGFSNNKFCVIKYGLANISGSFFDAVCNKCNKEFEGEYKVHIQFMTKINENLAE